MENTYYSHLLSLPIKDVVYLPKIYLMQNSKNTSELLITQTFGPTVPINQRSVDITYDKSRKKVLVWWETLNAAMK